MIEETFETIEESKKAAQLYTQQCIQKNDLVPMYKTLVDGDLENLFSIACTFGEQCKNNEIDCVEEIYQDLLFHYPEYGENYELG